MTTNVGALVATLAMETAAFRRDSRAAAAALQSDTAKMNKSLAGIQKSVRAVEKQGQALKRAFTGVGAAFAALGLGVFVRDVIRTSAEFQKMQASLKTVTGSSAAAAKAFAQIKQFAATTPFDLQQVTEGFIKLKALGLDPSSAALKSYGNTASAMGKSLNQMVEAVADATTGQFERLLDFGIKAKSEGNKVSLTFQGVTKTIGKNATEIEAYLRRIGDVNFASAMDEQSRTLGGALSNLGDAFAVFQYEVGEGGLASAVADVAREMSDATNGSHNLARSLGAVLGQAVRGIAAAARFAADNIRLLTAAVAAFAAYKIAAFVTVAAVAFINLAKAMRAAAISGALLSSLQKGGKKGIAGVLAAAAAFGSILLAADEAKTAIDDATTSIGEFAEAASPAGGGGSSAVNDKVAESIAAYERQNAQIERQISALHTSAGEYQRVTDQIELLNEAQKLGEAGADGQAAAWLRAAQANQALQKELTGLQAIQQAQEEVNLAEMQAASAGLWSEEARRASELAIERQRQINALTREYGTIAEGTGARLLELYDQQIAAQELATQRTAESTAVYTYVSDFADRAFDRIGSAVTDMFVRGEEAAVSFGNVARAMLAELAQDMMKLAASNLMKAIFNTAGGGSSGGGGIGGFLGNMAGNFLGSMFGGGGGSMSLGTPIATIHTGGTVGTDTFATRRFNPGIFANAPRLHDGLRSDEFPAVLQKGETVIPKGGSGGDGTTVYLDARGADAGAVARIEAALSEHLGSHSRIVRGDIADAMNRDPRWPR